MSSETRVWDQGWYRFARRLDSVNQGDRPGGIAVELIVLHAISLPPGQYGSQQVQALFTNRLDCNADPYFQTLRGLTVSAHFFIERSGRLWQFVSCDQRAWHAGVSRHLGRENCNDFSVGIELEGLEGDGFEAAQYESLRSVCAALADRYPIRHIAGHEHIAPGRKHDPGAGFDWPGFAASMALPARFFPAPVASSSAKLGAMADPAQGI